MNQRQKTEANIREQLTTLLLGEGIMLTEEQMDGVTEQCLNAVLPQGSVIVAQDHLDELEESVALLIALQNAGVDNWVGYDIAMENR